ncbi:MAG TPA: LCP family protein [Acidimicrobiales bacterium]
MARAERLWRSWRRHADKPRRTWGQRLVLAAGCLTMVGLVASAGGLAYVYRKYERLPRVELTGVLDDRDGGDGGEPENYLIVGVDNASGLDEDDPVRRGRDDLSRSDTIMILRIDPRSRQAALLSLPRDLWVPIAGTNSHQRINTAIERGGPQLLIRTIREYLGIRIHHYVQVDFASFQGLVEAVDGVPVYVPHPARDRQTGLNLSRGCVTLDPEQALAYVRSRHYEERIDGEWVEDPRSDLGRIQRQQDFIRRALSRAIDRGARNPRRLDELIDVGLDGITVDDELTADDIFRLGNRFRSFDPEDLVSYSVPTVQDRVGVAQVLRLLEAQAEPVLAVFRGGAGAADDADGSGGDDKDGEDGVDGGTEADDLSPASVRLEVLNGSGAPGQASDAAGELAGAGFGVAGAGEAATFDHERTVVRYPAGQREAAELVESWLASGAVLEEMDEGEAGAAGGAADGIVVVVTGADWAGVLDEPRAVDGGDEEASTTTTTPLSETATTSSLPPSSDLTTTTGSDAGSGTSGSRETTTTTDAAARSC